MLEFDVKLEHIETTCNARNKLSKSFRLFYLEFTHDCFCHKQFNVVCCSAGRKNMQREKPK